ncbi:hypothetical protein [Methanobrevibacter sp.]|uniref:hypothetical protein n=1 Tax=Methanobrevibacter sp. TaxID=66852 RepID=UPI0038905EB6
MNEDSIDSDIEETTENNSVQSGDLVKTEDKSKKSGTTKFSTTTKIFLGVATACIILFVIGIVAIGFSMMNSADDAGISDSSSETLSPSFTDTIYGINFQIPEGYETFSGTDNKNKGTMVTYDRSYLGPDGNIIEISISTTQGSFYWDLSQNREYDDVEKTINGHDGVMKSSGIFSYVTGDKLVVITGADEQQLESIIIE